jgi:hypothetical protein
MLAVAGVENEPVGILRSEMGDLVEVPPDDAEYRRTPAGELFANRKSASYMHPGGAGSSV